MEMNKKVLKEISILFLVIVVIISTLAAYQFILYCQSLQLPAPSGSFDVGRIEFDWVDDSRVDPLADRDNRKRELLVWAWYPITQTSRGSSAPFLPSAWVKAHNEVQGIERFHERDYSSVQTHSFLDVPVSDSQKDYPVIIMQPGLGLGPADYTVFAENLASHGYIVFGINQTHTSNLVVFPDGRVILSSEKGSVNTDTFDADLNRIGMVWKDDALFVLNRIESIDAEATNLFHNKLDLEQIGFFGHSFGGATAVSVM